MDSLPAEPQGKPKNTGTGSLFLLQGIFLTQESNEFPALQADSLPNELSGKPKNPLNVSCSGAPQFVFKISILNCYIRIGLRWWWAGRSCNRKNLKDSTVVEMIKASNDKAKTNTMTVEMTKSG